MTHSAVRELLGAYALDACDDTETRAIERHLTTCTECASELRTMQDAVRLLDEARPDEA